MTDGDDDDDDDMALGGSNNTDGRHLAKSLLYCGVLDLDLKPSIHAVSLGFTSSEKKTVQAVQINRTDVLTSSITSMTTTTDRGGEVYLSLALTDSGTMAAASSANIESELLSL